MNRWIRAALAAALTVSVAHAVLAQGIVREAPADVRRPACKSAPRPRSRWTASADRLSPGARIRDIQNLLVLSGSLAGQAVPVVYRRDAAGLVHEAWILTEDEYARVAPRRQRPRSTFAEAAGR